MNELRWRGWLVAAAIFVLGVGVGVAGTAVVGVRILRNSALNPARNRTLAERAAERIGADLTKNLNLTPQESAQVQAILNQSAGNLRAMRQQLVGQARTEMRSAAKQIAAILPPDKRAEFQRLAARRFDRLGLGETGAGENP